jgi:hypothetical protein
MSAIPINKPRSKPRGLTILTMIVLQVMTMVNSALTKGTEYSVCSARDQNKCSSCWPFNQENSKCPSPNPGPKRHNLPGCLQPHPNRPRDCVLCLKTHILVVDKELNQRVCVNLPTRNFKFGQDCAFGAIYIKDTGPGLYAQAKYHA